MQWDIEKLKTRVMDERCEHASQRQPCFRMWYVTSIDGLGYPHAEGRAFISINNEWLHTPRMTVASDGGEIGARR